jgi:hypothetical protein
LSVILYIGLVAVYLATLPWAVLADILAFPWRLGLWYAFERPLFQMLKAFRQVLVMTGYLLPMEDEIAQSLIRVGSATASGFRDQLDHIGDVFGGALPASAEQRDEQTFRDPHYPHSHPPGEFRHPWSYPPSPPALPDERALTTAGPHPAAAGPSVLFGGTGSDPMIRDRLEEAATAAAADTVGRDVTPRSHLGDAVEFSQYLLWLESREPTQRDGTKVSLVDWNLDADRGYGYHCWDWNRHSLNDRQFPPQPDPEGFKYAQPCTWPAQADDFRWDPSRDLQIHWVGPGLKDPGCGPDFIIEQRVSDPPVKRSPR